MAESAYKDFNVSTVNLACYCPQRTPQWSGGATSVTVGRDLLRHVPTHYLP